MQRSAPYGSWESLFTTDLITQGTVGFGQVAGDGDRVYWSELRPWEGGRAALVCRHPDGRREDLTPPPFNVRSRVHEYGGASFAVADGTAWFVDGGDNRLYRVTGDGAPRPVTRPQKMSFADLQVDTGRDRVIAVAERSEAPGEPENTLVAIAADGTVTTLAGGADFYAFPRLSPDGKTLAWIQWSHPNMPWNGTDLYAATFDASGALSEPLHIAGGPSESVFQPDWSPDGELFYVSDRSGFWNLFKAGPEPRHYAVDSEFGLPLWQFGMATYAFVDASHALCAHAVDGRWRLAMLDTVSGLVEPVASPYATFSGLARHRGGVLFVGGRRDGPDEVVAWRTGPDGARVLHRASEAEFDPADVSVAVPITFASANGRQAHAFYYPPANARFGAPTGEKPPLIVKGHGGPTGQASDSLAPKVQFWTSRGFAVVDVNYSGSTGFGRAYRDRLQGQWGIIDVEDCVHAALHLAERGLVDRDRMAISGGSAGGYTVLCALTFHDVFRAGASSYGIGDLEALARDTHKFESRYMDWLVGEWPEQAELYRARSPIHHTALLNCPVIFLQGAEDKVVPPNQAEAMVAALKEKGLPVAYLLFEGEGHGFRKAENVRAALEAELSFYGQVFGFEPAGSVPKVAIENL